MTIRSLLPAALLVLGCSLHRRPATPEPARGPARDSLFRLDETRADSVARRGPVDGMLALMGANIVYLRAGVPTVYGRDAARALLAAGAASPVAIQTWQPLGGGVSNDLRDAYTFGVAASITPPAAEIQLGRYIAYWSRERSQPWRMAAYVEIGSPSAAEVAFAANQLVPPTRPLSRPLADIVSRVRAADSSFSELADRMGTSFALANTVAADGVKFGGSEILVGPKAIEEYYTTKASGTSLTWRPVFAMAAASGDLGFTIGESISTGRGPSGAAVQRFGKYLTVWKRMPDGNWKLAIDGGNATPAKAER